MLYYERFVTFSCSVHIYEIRCKRQVLTVTPVFSLSDKSVYVTMETASELPGHFVIWLVSDIDSCQIFNNHLQNLHHRQCKGDVYVVECLRVLYCVIGRFCTICQLHVAPSSRPVGVILPCQEHLNCSNLKIWKYSYSVYFVWAENH